MIRSAPVFASLVMIFFGVSAPLLALPQAQATTSDSGIQGTVRYGPLSGGPQRKDRPADAPYHGKLLVKRAADRSDVTEVESDENGRFKVVLPPGKYLIVNPPSQTMYPRLFSGEIVVKPHQFAEVNLRMDTGLR